MARLFTRASSHYLENATPVVTAYPMTFACWFYSTDATVAQALMGIFDTAGTQNYHLLLINGALAGDPVQARTEQGASSGTAATTTGYSANTWHHACGVFASATDRRAFIDGGSKGTDATSKTPAGLDVTAIGRRSSSANDIYMSGRITHPAIWNVVLADNEVAALARGLHPSRVRPDALVAFWPLYGDDSPEPDLHTAGGTRYPMTVTGAVKANDAPVVPYSARRWGSVPLIEVSSGDASLAAELAITSALSYPAGMTGGALFGAELSTASAQSLVASLVGSALFGGEVGTANAQSNAASLLAGARFDAGVVTAIADTFTASIVGGASFQAALGTASAQALAAVLSGQGDAQMQAAVATASALAYQAVMQSVSILHLSATSGGSGLSAVSGGSGLSATVRD